MQTFQNGFYLKANALDFALGLVLSQYIEDGQFHPIVLCSRKFFAVEINYETHDKKLLAIIDALEKWRHLLEEAQHTITIYIWIIRTLNTSQVHVFKL